MNFFALSNIVIILTNLPLTLFLFLNNKKEKTHIILGLLCFSAVLWGIGAYGYSSTLNKEMALFWWKFANVGSIFSTVTFYFFILSYLGIHQKYLSWTISLTTVFFLYLNFFETDMFIGNLELAFNQFYYINWPINKITPYLIYYLLYYFILLSYSFILLLKNFRQATRIKKQQMKYLIIGMLIGFIGCHSCFAPVFGLDLYPYLNIFIAFYTIPIIYAIIRYRLMNLTLVITKASIFVLVYALVLGIPLWLGYKHDLWQQSVWLMLFLASVGPYIYSYLRKQAENTLLQEQKVYQKTLKQASYGIGRIKDLPTLNSLIYRTLSKSVGIHQCAVYLNPDKDANQSHPLHLAQHDGSYPERLMVTEPVLNALRSFREPFITEELSDKSSMQTDKKNLAEFLNGLNCHVVIPVIQSDKLLCLILLGEKSNHTLYTDDDLTVFSILATQAGLAIENCQFIEEEQERIKSEGARARRESMDMMVSTMAHEIDNPITSVIGNSEIVREYVEMNKSHMPEKAYEEINTALRFVENDAERVSKIIKAVEAYSKGGEGQIKPVSVYDALEPYHTLLILVKKKIPGVNYTEEVQDNLPPVMAEVILLEEILINYAENAFHAVQHNDEKNVNLKITNHNDKLRIEITDNGYGIPRRIKEQLFEVPTTTKGSSEGTGIGLYRIRQICLILNAQYGVDSQGENKGSCFYVEIPFIKGGH